MRRMTSGSLRALSFSIPLALVAACGGNEAPPPAPGAGGMDTQMPAVASGWSVTTGVEMPESVYVDAESGFIYASQIVGAPDARDGNGRIARLNLDGTMDEADWVTGLNAPKGLRRAGDMLWTADLDQVVGIDIASGEITTRLTIDGAQFLNDVAAGPDGTVYVSDMMASRIHAIRDGQASVFAEGQHLEWPNGLLVEGDRLIVGGWGQPSADFTTEVPGRLFALDLQTAEKTLITPEPFANIDGVESDGSGGYVLTDWIAGSVLHVSGDGAVRQLRQFSPGTADLAFVAGPNVLIIPHMMDNRIEAYDLSGAL